MTSELLFWALTALAGVGAATVVLTRDVTRLALGLGGFLLAVAGYFALFGFGFLALAQLFVYVGGVLVLLLFAIMLVHRPEPGRPELTVDHDPLVGIACVGIAGFVVMALRPVVSALQSGTGAVGVGAGSPSAPADALGAVLLGDMLPQFELAGGLLLVALIAVVALSGGDDE